jgi:redox-regulated HSP33 family molecular chaperone
MEKIEENTISLLYRKIKAFVHKLFPKSEGEGRFPKVIINCNQPQTFRGGLERKTKREKNNRQEKTFPFAYNLLLSFEERASRN